MGIRPYDDTDRGMALLAYLVGIIGPVVALAVAPNRPYVRHHALQALIAEAAVMFLLAALSLIPFFGYAVFLLGLAAFAFFVYCGIRAYQGEAFEIPGVADLVRELGHGA